MTIMNAKNSNMENQNRPQVSPTDWASRRKHAMNRARELRSRRKDTEPHRGASDASLASRSELQRQRRSRQLEATQKLLDGRVGGFDNNSTEPSRGTGRSAGSVHSQGSRPNANSVDAYDGGGARGGGGASAQHRTAPGRSASEGTESPSVVSQKYMRRIREKFTQPAENDASSLDSRPKRDLDERSTRYHVKEDGMKFESLSSDATPHRGMTQSLREKSLEGRGRGSLSSDATPRHAVQQSLRENPLEGRGRGSLSSDATPHHALQQTLREKPLEGRGRGRGRRRSPLGSSSLEAPLNSKVSFHTHASAPFEGQMDDSEHRQPSLKSHQPRRENTINSDVSQRFLRCVSGVNCESLSPFVLIELISNERPEVVKCQLIKKERYASSS